MCFVNRNELRVTTSPMKMGSLVTNLWQETVSINQDWSLWSMCRSWSCSATAGIKVISSCCRKWASTYFSWKWRGGFTFGVDGFWRRWKILTPFSKGTWIKYECVINTWLFRGRIYLDIERQSGMSSSCSKPKTGRGGLRHLLWLQNSPFWKQQQVFHTCGQQQEIWAIELGIQLNGFIRNSRFAWRHQGNSLSQEISTASCFKEDCFQGRWEQLSFWWYLDIPPWMPPVPERSTGLAWDELAEGTRFFIVNFYLIWLNVGLHLFFSYPYCFNPSPILISQIHPFPLSWFSLTACSD